MRQIRPFSAKLSSFLKLAKVLQCKWGFIVAVFAQQGWVGYERNEGESTEKGSLAVGYDPVLLREGDFIHTGDGSSQALVIFQDDGSKYVTEPNTRVRVSYDLKNQLTPFVSQNSVTFRWFLEAASDFVDWIIDPPLGVEIVLAILWEPADWAYTIRDLSRGEWTALIGLFPVVPHSAGKALEGVVVAFASKIPWGKIPKRQIRKILRQLEDLIPIMRRQVVEEAGEEAAEAAERALREEAERGRRFLSEGLEESAEEAIEETLEESRRIEFTPKQIQKKYKHAEDFGLPQSWSMKNGEEYQKILSDHIHDPHVTPYFGVKYGKINPMPANILVIRVIKMPKSEFLGPFSTRIQASK